MGIITTISSLWVFVIMVSTVNARVINKRAAFYIANDTMCIVDGELYFNGDPVPTDDHCEKCTCRPPGFSCVLRDCEVKPGCKAVRKDGECCPDYICGCSHNGMVYKDGDFIRDLQNPCYTCRCHGSSISCTFADCLFRSDCGPEYIQGECCPRYDHCPALSTTQKTTTVITTVPITYDEITKPLFNLTSPPHERLATHTTIFPTTGTVTADDGETHTTETYEKPALSTISSEAAETTHVHDTTVTPTSESSTSHSTQAGTSAVTTSDSKTVTETEPAVHQDSSQEPGSLAYETASTESGTATTFSETDVKTDSEAKELTTTPITTELSSERVSLSEELHDAQTTESVTEVLHDTHKDESSTEVSHDTHKDESATEVSHDSQTDEVVTEVSHDRQSDAPVTLSHDIHVDEEVTEVSHDDKEDESETELSSSSQTTELVTEASHDRQTDESTQELPHESKTDHTPLESDETVSVTFSEETSKASVDTTKEDDSQDISENEDEIFETTTDMPTTHEELKTPQEDDGHDSHEAISWQPEEVGGSEGTSPSLLTTVTMSGDTDKELPTVKTLTTTEAHDVDSHDTHSETEVSDSSTTEVQDTTEGMHEDVVASDTSLNTVTTHDDHQTESEVGDKTTFPTTEHSDYHDSESSTIESQTKSYSFSTESVDDNDEDDFTHEAHPDENEISTQDAEELNLFTGAVTPEESHQRVTTVLDHISHLPSDETTHTHVVTSEYTEEHSSEASRVTHNHLQPETVYSNADDIDSYDHSFPPAQEKTTVHSTEVPHPTQHTQFVLHSDETATVQSVYNDSDDIHDETEIGDSGHNEDAEDFLSWLFAEHVTERSSDATQSTTEQFPDQVRPLHEVSGEENAAESGTDQSSSEDHEAPHLLSDGVNALSPEDEFNTEGQEIQTEADGSSKPSVIVTTEGTTETVIIMEAESDLSLTTSEDSSTMSSAEDVSITSSRATESSEALSLASESVTTRHADEVHESEIEHVTEDDLSIKSKEHELFSDKSHITSTVPPEQGTSDFHKNSDIALSSTEIPSDDLDHSEQDTDDSISSETDEHKISESSSLVTSDDTAESAGTEYSPEDSSDRDGNEVSPTTRLEGSGTTLKQISDEPKPTVSYDDDENSASSVVFNSGNFSEAEEHPDAQKDSTSVDELSTDSQSNEGGQITEDTSEITMNAEESIVNNGFESITDYLYSTEKHESNPLSITQDHASASKEDNDSLGHYTIDGETYHAQNGELLRISRSTSSNGMASSITVQYPEKNEVQTRHTSQTENENTGAFETTRITLSSFGNSAVEDDGTKSVTESLHIETTPPSFQSNTLESTHSTYLNSEVPSHTFEPSNEDLSTTPNTEESHKSQVISLITYEVGKPNGVDAELSDHQTKEDSEDEIKEEISVAPKGELSPSINVAADLLKDNNVAPDLIVPVEHQLHEAPFTSAETEKPTFSGHSADFTEEPITTPSTTHIPKITSSASGSESAETEDEDSSESYDKDNAFDRENDEDTVSRFSRTSERYTTNEINIDDDLSASTTENQPTISSYTMDADTETTYLDDSTDNEEEHTKDQSVNNSVSSGQTNVFESRNGQTESGSDSEEEELVGKEFQDGPEKGGEWFEPTIPVLAAIVVHEAEDKTGTSADIPTTAKYSHSTDFRETGETSRYVTEMAVQTENSLDSDHAHSSTSLEEEEDSKLPTTSSNVRDFTNSIEEDVVDIKSTNEVPSPTSVFYETTHLEAANDPELNTHQFLSNSVSDTDVNTNEPTTHGPQRNDVEVTVSSKLTFFEDTNGGNSEGLKAAASSEEIDKKETKEDELPEQGEVDVITHEYTTKLDQTDESITTSKINSITQRVDEPESAEISEAESKSATENEGLQKQKETKDESINSSQHEVENVDAETTKESRVSLNDLMLSDGVGNMMHFTDVITDGSDFIRGHVTTTVAGVADGDTGKGLQNPDSEDKFNIGPDEETNDEGHYTEGSSEENTSEEATMTTKVNSNGLTESQQGEEQTTDDGYPFAKTTENSVSPKDHTDGLQHKDDNYSTEHSSTSYYKSTTPLPLLLFNEFVEKVKEENLLNRISQPVEEQPSTVKPEEINEVLSEVMSDEKVNEDLEKQTENHPESSVISDEETGTTTQRNSRQRDSVSTTPTSDSEEKQTEIYSTTSRLEQPTSQNSYSTEISHSGNSPDESEKASDSTTSSQATEQSNKPCKNISRVFVIRKTHDDYQSDEQRSQRKEENAVEKNGVTYSDKTHEIAVNDPNDTNQKEHDDVAITTEVITQQDEGSTDDTQHRDFHESDLNSSPTSSSAEPTYTIDTNENDAIPSESSSDETFNSESTEVAQNSEDAQLKDVHDVHQLTFLEQKQRRIP